MYRCFLSKSLYRFLKVLDSNQRQQRNKKQSDFVYNKLSELNSFHLARWLQREENFNAINSMNRDPELISSIMNPASFHRKSTCGLTGDLASRLNDCSEFRRICKDYCRIPTDLSPKSFYLVYRSGNQEVWLEDQVSVAKLNSVKANDFLPFNPKFSARGFSNCQKIDIGWKHKKNLIFTKEPLTGPLDRAYHFQLYHGYFGAILSSEEFGIESGLQNFKDPLCLGQISD